MKILRFKKNRLKIVELGDKKRDFEFEKLKKQVGPKNHTSTIRLVIFVIIQPFKHFFLIPFISSTICIIKN